MIVDQLALGQVYAPTSDCDQAYTPSGVHIGTGIKITHHKGAINDYTIQNLVLAKGRSRHLGWEGMGLRLQK